MAVLKRNGAELHYESRGEGSPVILQHPLTADRRAFRANGVTGALRGLQCIMPDSLAHGQSSAPKEAHRYALDERVADVLAVADAVGAETFSFIGYSMGAWIGQGLLAHAPERLDIVMLGGWDPLEGARRYTAHRDASGREAEFGAKIDAMRAARDEQDPIQTADKAGMLRCYAELFGDPPPLPQRRNLALFCGAEDPYYPNAFKAARAIGAPLHTLRGDHGAAFFDPDLPQLVADALGGALFHAAQGAKP